MKGVIEVVAGIAIGAVCGWLLWFVAGDNADFHQDDPETGIEDNSLLRTSLTLFAGCAFVFVSSALEFEGSGPLGALTLAMVAGVSFRRKEQDALIEQHLTLIWNLSEPFLFGLIGAEVHISNIDPSNLLLVIAVVILDTAFRLIATYCSLVGGGLTVKEKCFVSIAWLNKAAVQAAVGPLALDAALKKGSGDEVILAKLVITVCVVTILLSTPIGTLGMALTAKRFLKQKLTPA